MSNTFNVGTAMAYLDLDVSKFKGGLSTAMTELQGFTNSSLSLSNRLGSLSTAINTVGSSMTKKLTVPIAGIGVAAVKTAGDFDESMSKVKAISGATSDEVVKLRDKAIEMGAKTKFSAKESADAFTYMAMAGWDAGQMMDGISGIMSLAAADGLDLATTSDIVTDALTAFGLQAADSGHFADILAQASSSANTNVSMLGESFKYVAPVAGALGMSAEDTALALGLMANAGIKSSQAGTSLRTSLTNMVKPSEAMAIKMEELGIEVTNADGTMKSLKEILDMLREKFSTLSESEQANAAATIFGKEAMSGMLAIISTSQEDYDKLADAINNTDGRANEMANTMMDNLPGAITLLKSALESLFIKIGEMLVPTIKKITEFITKIVEKLNTLSDEQMQQIVNIALIVAAVGPALMVIAKVISTVATLISAVKTIFSVGSMLLTGIKALVAFISGTLIPAIASIGAPVLIVIAVIGALIAIGVALYKNWDEISAWASKTWEAIKETIGAAIDNIKEFFSNLSDAVNDVVQSIVTWLSDLWDSIAGFFGNLISNVTTWFGNVWDTITSFFNNLVSGIVGWFKGIWDSITSFFAQIGTILGKLGEFFSGIIDAVFGFFSDLFEKITGSLKEIITSIVNFGKDIVSKAVEIGKEFVSKFAATFSSLVSSVKEFINNFVSMIVEWGTGLVSKAKEIGGKFVEAITSSVTKVGSWFADVFNDIFDTITSLLPKMVKAGKNVINNLWKGMKEVFKSVTTWISDTLKELFQPIVDWFNEKFAPIKSLFEKVGSFFSGSHANGLDYVPYNGYIAELHQGERVLTKAENKEYNGRSDGNSGGGDTFNFYNTKPDPYEYARQMKRVKKELQTT